MGSIVSRIDPRQSSSDKSSVGKSSQVFEKQPRNQIQEKYSSEKLLDMKVGVSDSFCQGDGLTSKPNFEANRIVNDLRSIPIEYESIESLVTIKEKPSKESKIPISLRKKNAHSMITSKSDESHQSYSLNVSSNTERMNTERPTNLSRNGSDSFPKASISYCDKENVGNVATQARSVGEEQKYCRYQILEPLQSKDLNAAGSSTQRLQKKLRASPYRCKSSRVSSSNSKINDGNECTITNMDEGKIIISNHTIKVPVDPPGAILGAHPWMPSNLENSSTNIYTSHSRPHLHPSLSPMNSWTYQPSTNAGCPPFWTMSPFCTPLVATFRYPFVNFVVNHSSLHAQFQHCPHYGCDCQPIPHRLHTSIKKGITGTPMSSNFYDISCEDGDDSLKLDAITKTADSTKSIKNASKNVCSACDLPSTFAPIDCIVKIKAKRKAASEKAAQSKETKFSTKSEGHVITRSAANAIKKGPKFPAQQAVSHGIAQKHTGLNGKSKILDLASFIPEVLTVLGKKVTMIDPVRKVFVIDLISPETCDEIRRLADNHTHQSHTAGSKTEVWRTLYTYTKMDLPVCEVSQMREKYTDIILLEVKKIVGEIFGMKKEAMKLRPRSWKEPHLLLYQALDGKPHHTGIEMHYDGCDITWQALLTRNDEYEGGGTYFRCLRKTVVLKQGQVLVHPGELYHKGIDITYGVRCLLVCFTDGMNPKILDDSKQEDDDPEWVIDNVGFKRKIDSGKLIPSHEDLGIFTNIKTFPKKEKCVESLAMIYLNKVDKLDHFESQWAHGQTAQYFGHPIHRT